jgi:hypothetical protein
MEQRVKESNYHEVPEYQQLRKPRRKAIEVG